MEGGGAFTTWNTVLNNVPFVEYKKHNYRNRLKCPLTHTSSVDGKAKQQNCCGHELKNTSKFAQPSLYSTIVHDISSDSRIIIRRFENGQNLIFYTRFPFAERKPTRSE